MRTKEPRKPVVRKIIFSGVFLFFAFCFTDAFLEPGVVTVREYRIKSAKIPQTFAGFRIVFLADTHVGRYFSLDRLRGLVTRVDALEPDLVLLGGDYVQGGYTRFDPCMEILGSLRAPQGMYAVLGNHDHWAGSGAAQAAMQKHGINVLDNRGFWITKNGSRFRLGGVGDLSAGTQNLAATITGTGKNDFVLLVSHNPDYAEQIPDNSIDLMLSGHTHGGQVTLFGLHAPLLPVKTGQKYRTGLVETNGFKVIVSNGIGVISPPIRFFAPPQIVLVVLEAED